MDTATLPRASCLMEGIDQQGRASSCNLQGGYTREEPSCNLPLLMPVSSEKACMQNLFQSHGHAMHLLHKEYLGQTTSTL